MIDDVYTFWLFLFVIICLKWCEHSVYTDTAACSRHCDQVLDLYVI